MQTQRSWQCFVGEITQTQNRSLVPMSSCPVGACSACYFVQTFPMRNATLALRLTLVRLVSV